MMVDGNFKFADIRSKQLIAVEFPYKNEKYSLTIIMPDTFKDLKYFTQSSDYNSLNEITSQLEPTDIKILMPKFRVEFTSKADKALGKVSIAAMTHIKPLLRWSTRCNHTV
jgi:serine protease inhibitor